MIRVNLYMGRRRIVMGAGGGYFQRTPAGGCFTTICHHLHSLVSGSAAVTVTWSLRSSGGVLNLQSRPHYILFGTLLGAPVRRLYEVLTV